MAFKLENFGAEVANAKSTLGGICYYRYFNEDNNTLTTAGYFPATLGLEVGDRIRVIPSVKTNADEIYIVTNTDNRTVVVKQIDTDGAVDSVNGKTGDVTITADDVLPTQTDNSGKFLTTNGTNASWASVSEVPATTGATAGDVLTLDSSSNPVWQAPSGGSSLPTQTGNAGKFLTTDGTDASWGTTIQDTLYFTKNSNIIELLRFTNNFYTLFQLHYYGQSVSSLQFTIRNPNNTYAAVLNIGGDGITPGSQTPDITLGNSSYKWAITFTKKLNNGADITVPTTGGTMVVATPPTTDGTYVLKATVASGVVTYAWVAE